MIHCCAPVRRATVRERARLHSLAQIWLEAIVLLHNSLHCEVGFEPGNFGGTKQFLRMNGHIARPGTLFNGIEQGTYS